MKLEKVLYNKSHLYFIGFFAFVLIAFWLTYFTKFFEQANFRMHLHGITLIIWCLMLIIQPYLIRTKQNTLHRQVGKFSYILVPVLLFTTTDLLIYRLKGQNEIDYFFVALVMNALVAFIILYGLAIYNRKNASLHARFMVSTIFPFFTPLTDRIISIYFPSVIKYFPIVNGYPNIQLFGFILADAILVILCIWDWRSHKRLNVFPITLAVLVVYHYSVLNFYKYDFWKAFSHWLV
jgi:hypothetical protein